MKKQKQIMKKQKTNFQWGVARAAVYVINCGVVAVRFPFFNAVCGYEAFAARSEGCRPLRTPSRISMSVRVQILCRRRSRRPPKPWNRTDGNNQTVTQDNTILICMEIIKTSDSYNVCSSQNLFGGHFDSFTSLNWAYLHIEFTRKNGFK